MGTIEGEGARGGVVAEATSFAKFEDVKGDLGRF